MATNLTCHHLPLYDRGVISTLRHALRPAPISLLLVGTLYLAALLLQAHDEPLFWSPDEGAKYVQLTSLRWQPSLNLSVPYPGSDVDPAYRYPPFLSKQSFVQEGKLYLQWPVFLPLLTWLPWKLLGSLGLYVVPLLAGLLTLWLTYQLTCRLLPATEQGRAWLSIPILGLTTPLAFYSTVYFEHTLACALVVLACYALVRAYSPLISPASEGGRGGERWLLLCGLALAGAIWLRSELYILAVVVVASLVLQPFTANPRNIADSWRKVLAVGGGLLAGLLPLWGFYLAAWGSLLPKHATPYLSDGKGGLPPARFISEGGIRTFLGTFLLGPRDDLAPTPDLGPQLASPLRSLFLLAIGLFIVGCVLRPGWRQAICLGGGLAATTLVSGIVLFSGEQYTALHGFLLPTPALLLATLTVGPVSRRVQGNALLPPSQPAASTLFIAIVAAYIGLHTLAISLLSGLGPSSQVEWGQRYLLPAYPLLVCLAVVALPRLWRGGGRWLLATVLAVSLLVGGGLEVRGWLAGEQVRAQTRAWRTLVRQTTAADALILTTEWWVPLRLNLYAERRLHLSEPGESDDWAASLRQTNRRDFYLLSTAAAPPPLKGATFAVETGRAGGLVLRRYLVQ